MGSYKTNGGGGVGRRVGLWQVWGGGGSSIQEELNATHNQKERGGVL